jgi:hypothetical protein
MRGYSIGHLEDVREYGYNRSIYAITVGNPPKSPLKRGTFGLFAPLF